MKAETITQVRKTIMIANKTSLEGEVIAEAMYALKIDPTKTIKEALEIGLTEWVK